MKLSVIIPTFNEVHFIHQLIESIQNIDETEKEIFIVDGGSADGTREAVRQMSGSHPDLKLVENPAQYVSQGFNKAFQQARGQYIALVGAHAIYPKNYFRECIKVIEDGKDYKGRSYS